MEQHIILCNKSNVVWQGFQWKVEKRTRRADSKKETLVTALSSLFFSETQVCLCVGVKVRKGDTGRV